MVRIRVMSDLHLEAGDLEVPNAGENVVVLAGDVHVRHSFGAMEPRARRQAGRARCSSPEIMSSVKRIVLRKVCVVGPGEEFWRFPGLGQCGGIATRIG
jgi:hypothetical protein